MKTKKQQKFGFMLAELIVGITVLAALIIAVTLSLHGFKQFNHYQWMRQHCLAAAQAQMDSVATTAAVIPETQLQALWPRVTVALTREPGQGQWQGLQRIDVMAQGKSYERTVKITLSRYVQR
jgi:type II secretory pathway pseudopilin PulG